MDHLYKSSQSELSAEQSQSMLSERDKPTILWRILLTGFMLLLATPLATNFSPVHHDASTIHPNDLLSTQHRTLPAPTPQWKTIQTFTAIGSLKTSLLTVPAHWRILWSCGKNSQDDYSLFIDVDRPDGSSLAQNAVVALCQQTTISSSNVQEYQGGTVYLNIVADALWTISIQTLENKPAQPLAITWRTTRTFTDDGNKPTPLFIVPQHWRIVWHCDLSPLHAVQFFANLNSSNGALLEPEVVNTFCQKGNTSNTAEEYRAGTFYLDVSSNAHWTIQVQIPG